MPIEENRYYRIVLNDGTELRLLIVGDPSQPEVLTMAQSGHISTYATAVLNSGQVEELQPWDVDMTDPDDAARWMYNYLCDNSELEQEFAALTLQDRFAQECTYTNKNGNLAIARIVLKHFKGLHGGDAGFQQSGKYWYWK
jgi:hypothetical protein